MARGKYPTAPRQTGDWTYTTNEQKRVGADKVWGNRVRLAAMAPSVPPGSKAARLHGRAVKLSKPPYRDI